jgi:hypothetical protein
MLIWKVRTYQKENSKSIGLNKKRLLPSKTCDEMTEKNTKHLKELRDGEGP